MLPPLRPLQRTSLAPLRPLLIDLTLTLLAALTLVILPSAHAQAGGNFVNVPGFGRVTVNPDGTITLPGGGTAVLNPNGTVTLPGGQVITLPATPGGGNPGAPGAPAATDPRMVVATGILTGDEASAAIII
ncbi:MAG: hypothetical protein H7343_19740, partial [Undibacterium sp.]|nr:hypothetical protein [Opitutaceae bacterium]